MGRRTAVGTKSGPDTLLKGYSGKGSPLADAGQIDLAALVGAPTGAVIVGMAQLRAVVMRKKKATGYEYEQVDYDKIGAMKAAGYDIVQSASYPIKTLPSTTASASVAQSKKLNVKLTAQVSYEWSQSVDIYNRVGAAARTRLGQNDGPVLNRDEAVYGCSGFIFPVAYADFKPGTYIPLKGIKARYRYAAPTAATATDAGTSGIYTSFAADTAWTA